MRFHVLGPVEVTRKGRQVPIGGPKQRTVLALLVAGAGVPLSTDALIEGVYGEDAPSGARRSIQTYVSNLRSVLGDVIESTGSGYRLTADPSDVDAVAFQDAVESAMGEEDPATRATTLREALVLWRGHPYADVDGITSLAADIGRLNELRVRAVEERIDADLELGRHAELIAELESLTEEYPLRERLRGQHMLALYRSDRQAEALRAYERTRSYLVDEMGLDPSQYLRDMERRILEHDPSLTFQTGPVVRRAAILVADVADPRALSSLEPNERDALIRIQSEALRDAAAANGGDLFAYRGSAVYAEFQSAQAAVAAATATQHELAAHQPMRVAIATGEVQISSDGAAQGPPVTRAAQLVAMAHGGQVLLSADANQSLADSGDAGWIIRALGKHHMDGTDEHRLVYQLVVDGLPTAYPPLRTELLPPPLPLEGAGIPGYELRERVGSGAFGVVHRAYQPSVGREVAIKIIRPEYANDARFIRRFEVEAQLVARLEHRQIVPLHDYWRSPDGAYLVMRWLRGGTLQDRIDAGPMALDEADGLVRQIAPALAFAHHNGVIHRDLKPSNILLDEEGTAYLSDFGIARRAADHDGGSVAADVQDLAAVVAMALHGEPSHPAVLDLLTRTAAGNSDATFDTVGDFVAAWTTVLGDEPRSDHAAVYTPTRNPYKGLHAFGELDASDFYGRDEDVTEILETLRAHRLVAVVGPSGIGKSSVTRAGVIPALRRGAIDGSDAWLITDMLPGAHPYEELASALLRVAKNNPGGLEDELRADDRGLVRCAKRYLPRDHHLLLIIDQFEELFTLASETVRSSFLTMLSETVADDRSNVSVIVTMRADFFDRPLRFADLGDALRAGTVPIATPSHDSLAAIVASPAESVGVAFEPGLVDLVVADVRDQPGALPLLEYSLTELFKSRDSDVLTVAAYEASGGVLAALGRRAESIYGALDAAEAEACRQLFLRLVQVDEGGRDTRRRVRLGELERLGLDARHVQRVLADFSEHRLLTFDRDPITHGPTVEVAHEAILTEWSRLAEWIEAQREHLLLHSRLAVAVADWEHAGRSEDYLLTGGTLAQHASWTGGTDLTLTSAEQAFLDESRRVDAERRAQRRRTRRLVLSGFAAAAVIAVVLAGFAFNARNEADRRAEEAAAQTMLAESAAADAQRSEDRALANERLAEENAALAEQSTLQAEGRALLASSAAALADDPDLAMLLALEGANLLDGDTRSVAALRKALNASRTIYTGRWPSDLPSRSVTGDLAPDGKTVAVSGGIGDHFEVRDLETDTVVWSHDFDAPIPEEIEITLQYFDGGSQLLAAVLWFPELEREFDPAPEAAGLYAFDAATGELLREYDSGRCGAALSAESFSQAFTANETSDRYAVVTYYSDSFPRCGNAGAPPLSDAVVVDLIGGVSTPVVTEWSAFDGPIDFALSEDGTRAMYLSADFEAVVVDLPTQNVVSRRTVNAGDVSFALTADGSRAAIGNGSGVRNIELYDASTGELIRTLPGHTGDVAGMAFVDGDRRLVTAGGDALVRFWDVDAGVEVDSIGGAAAPTSGLRLSADGRRIVVFSQSDTWRVISLDPAELAEGATLEACDGAPGTFHLRGGVTVTEAVTMVFTWCDGGARNLHLWDRASGEATVFEGWEGQAAAITRDGSRFGASRMVFDDGGMPTGSEPYAIYASGDSSRLLGLSGICGRPDLDSIPDTPDCRIIDDMLADDVSQSPPFPLGAFDLEFSEDGRLLAAADWAGVGALFDTATGERLMIVPGSDVAISPSGETVAFTAEIVAELHLYDTTTLEQIGVLESGSEEVAGQFLIFSPDGSLLVGATSFGQSGSKVVVHDGRTLEPLRAIEDPHQGRARDIHISSDGRLLATGGADGWVRVWDIDTLELVGDLPISDDRIQSVEFADGDTKLVVATPSGPIREILLDPSDLIRHARSRITRGFTPAECAEFFPDANCPTFEELRTG